MLFHAMPAVFRGQKCSSIEISKPMLAVCGLCCVLVTALNDTGRAQDVRVITTISHREPEEGRWNPVSRSLTLFHGGKVYDKVEEVGELVIHEPAKHQFVILSQNGNRMATRVRYEELLQFLKLARNETVKYMIELDASPQQSDRAAVEALGFQLNPKFEESFDSSTGKLRLSSRFVTYDVATDSVDRAGVVSQYLSWADWTARLNFVLHPQAVTPEARIELNKALLARDRIPTQVDLTLSLDGKTQLKAEHRFYPSLRTFDKSFITGWEKDRNANDLRWVDLREYQRLLLTGLDRKRR